MSKQPDTLKLAQECEESAEMWAHEIDTRVKAAAELRRLHDLLGKANALARIRHQRINQLETAVNNLNKVRGRYNTQIAAAELFALCGLPSERPAK
jgi:hypothetical protein